MSSTTIVQPEGIPTPSRDSDSPGTGAQEKGEQHSDTESGHHGTLTREKPDSDTFPEGGVRAWLVAAGAGCVMFSTLGYGNAYGVFQQYYQVHQLRDVGPDDIAWIGGVQAFLTLATGAIGGPLFDRYGAWVCRSA